MIRITAPKSSIFASDEKYTRRCPSPPCSLAATISPPIAVSRPKIDPTMKPTIIIGSASGKRILRKIWNVLAPYERASAIFAKIRFPLALPMIIVGYMVGSIFGLLTAIGGEMVAASEQGGLGQRLVYFSSLAKMDDFGAVILIIAALGVTIYVLFYWIGKKWASWEA